MRESFQFVISPLKMAISVACDRRICGAPGAGAVVDVGGTVGKRSAVAGTAEAGEAGGVLGAADVVGEAGGVLGAADVVGADEAAWVVAGTGEAIMMIGAGVGTAVPGTPQLDS